MENKFLAEQAIRKWKPVLDHKDMAPIVDAHKRATIATLLENQEKAIKEQMLVEAPAPTSSLGLGMNTLASASGAGNIAGYDPILIQLVRRAMPNLMAYDICGVQAMSAPTGLIFAMRSRYLNPNGTEAFYNEPSAGYAGSVSTTSNASTAGTTGPTGVTATFGPGTGVDPFFGYSTSATLNPTSASGLTTGGALTTAFGEANAPAEMAFSIERVGVQAATRMLAASYSVELAQDLKAVHGLDAENELANILSTEILAEINREVVRNVYRAAKLGAQQSDLYYKTVAGGLTTAGNGTAYGGVYDLIQDSDGRWSAEKFRGLMFQIERECNQIAKDTRRGKGNFIICSADVASALAMGGFLNISPALNVSLDVDDTGNTFAGTLNGKIKVYIDPYVDVTSGTAPNFVCVGYKGTSPYDAGLFYCPYVPLQMMRAVDTTTFQPKMAFKTRYGMVANPFAEGSAAGLGALNARTNVYYRIFRVDNLHGVAS
jgi:hypothetical protein